MRGKHTVISAGYALVQPLHKYHQTELNQGTRPVKTQLIISSIGICALLFSAACEGGGSNDVDPRLIEGGGLGDGEIDGKVNIYVVEGETSESVAISGAKIYIGEPGEEATFGETDSTGLLTVEDGSLDGPTTITVVAGGFVTSTWYGANGANITIPLDRLIERNDFGRATLSGSVEGWTDVPEPATNHFIAGVLGYSQTNGLDDPANEIEQPSGGSGLAPNLCVRTPQETECTWSIITRTGEVALYATIIDIDTKGTESEADDTSEVIGYAYALGLTVEDDVRQSGITLQMVASSALSEVDIAHPSVPSGVDTAGVLLGIDLGDAGTMMLGVLETENGTSMLAPDLSGDFAGATYRSYAFASNKDDDDEDGRPTSAVLLRDISDVSGGIDFGDWLELPSGLAIADGVFSYSSAAQSALSTAEIRNSSNDKLWSMVFLDGRTSFELPTLPTDPIASGTFNYSVSSFDDTINLLDFQIEDIGDTIARISTNRVEFTR